LVRLLMESCLNQGSDICDHRVLEAYMGDAPEERSGSPELNRICEACPGSCFRMTGLVCPICGEHVSIIRGDPELVNVGEGYARKPTYHFFCKNCGRDLFCERDLLG